MEENSIETEENFEYKGNPYIIYFSNLPNENWMAGSLLTSYLTLAALGTT